jgi:hypothetical protein
MDRLWFWAVFGVLILVAGVYFVGRLIYLLVGSFGVVHRATAAARAEWRKELTTLTPDEIRARLIRAPYFSDDLRSGASIQQFLSRIERHDEVALAADYPSAKLYSLLVSAESVAGRTGRPEAVDAIDEISDMLQELARRTSHTTG